MSLIPYTLRTLQCDAPRCPADFDIGPGATAAEVRDAALREGWSFRKGDWCPLHHPGRHIHAGCPLDCPEA